MDELRESVEQSTTTQKGKNSSSKWHKELALAEKEFKKFWERGRKVLKRYLDESNDTLVVDLDAFNVFWANVGVLKASLYANPPKPAVKREWDDFMDDQARVAALMMERLLNQSFEKPESDMNVAFEQCIEDRLIPGMAQVWLSYKPEIDTTVVQEGVKDKKGRVLQEEILNEEITNEYVPCDYVYWEDFWFSPCRTWDECRWVAKREWLTKSEFTERFGKDLAKKVTWTKKPPMKFGEKVTPDNLGIERTEVFEIWHKSAREVCWVSRSCAEELDSCGDPLELANFFPCPKPLLATHTTSNLIPKNDYLMVQSQYRRLDNLSRRIGLLEDAVQASGVYDKTNKELSQLLPSSGSNRMIPVDNWAMFAEKGGLKGVVEWFPLDMIVAALDKLREMKVDAKAELFELTGLSDIMRGQTNARETLGAQQLKSQYSSVRLQYLQGEVAKFIQEALRIKSEIISKHFQLQTIVRNSLIEYTPDADLGVAAAQLLKDDWQRCYRIQVYADTLAIPDYNAERQGRTEFVTGLGQFIAQAMPLIDKNPESGPFMLRIIQWAAASFRSAASIEGVFDKWVTLAEEKLKQPPPPPPPDPAVIKAEADVKAQAAKAQIETDKAQAQIQADATRTATEIASATAKANAEIQNNRAKTREQIEASRAKTAAQIAAIVAKQRATKKGE